MPIKLLSKQEVQQKQAVQKRAEIEEGKKLAQRVDRLREIAVQEEASLASFRAKTLKAINTEIKQVTVERDSLLEEVKTLRNELELGFSELKKAEKQLKDKEKEVLLYEEQVETRLKLVKEKEKSIKADFEQNKRFIRRIENLNSHLLRIHPLVEERLETAESVLEEIELKKFQFETFYNQFTKELRGKDIEVASRERDITIKEERVKNTERLLNEREIQLRDRELTLEREFNRLKKRV